MRTFLAIATVAFAALAGCSDAPASADFAADRQDIPLDGSVTVNHVAESGRNPSSQIPGAGESTECAQDDVAALDPNGQLPVEPCVEASATFDAHFMELPLLEEGSYKLMLVGADATTEIGILSDSNGMYVLNKTLTGDHSAATEIQLVYGDLVVATSPATNGPQDFVLNPELAAVEFTGAYKGKEVQLDVSGLPGNATYEAWLVSIDEAGAKTHAVSWSVQNGNSTHESTTAVGDYQELHIHVKGSKINVGIAVFE